ncbi:MAG TPA: hypothetical protein VHK22_02950 [Gaiellaceae bacterium]|jgi:hypothetical protein|nr:hypothetical protein [Gaiellaceae bacterium]
MSAAETPEPHATATPPALSPHGLRIEAPPTGQAAAEETWAEENFFRVVLNLEGGEWVEVGSFGDEGGAEACARELVGQLAERRWPRVKSRYLRPETILSVEVSERRRYTGSTARTAWGQTG